VYIVLTVIGFVSPFSFLKSASLLIWVLVFVKKNLKIDVTNKKFKDGPLNKWKQLDTEGYISIMRKIDMSTKKVSEIKLLWVSDGKSKQIYGPIDMDNAEDIALYLADHWKCGVYQAHNKAWLRE
jgi:hypothetical protein